MPSAWWRVQVACPPGRFANSTGSMTAACSGPCARGAYCVAGSVSEGGAPCPPGTFGNTTGLGKASCSGTCAPGYYCTAGSTNPLATPCPGGKFGADMGLGEQSCSGDCDAGYYCPTGSTSATQNPCNGSAKYCPAASSAPSNVPSGYYSFPVGGDRATSAFPCTESTYCVGGVQQACPAGRFGDRKQLASPACEGKCPAGFYCGLGTTSKTAIPCGNVSVYCPEGSSSPTWVDAGYKTMPMGGPESMRMAQALCSAGTYCLAGVQILCPYGAIAAAR